MRCSRGSQRTGWTKNKNASDVCSMWPPEKGYKINNSHKKLIGLGLRGAVGVWRVEEIVDSEQHLLDRDGGPPTLVLVEDAGGREHFEFEGKGTRGLI